MNNVILISHFEQITEIEFYNDIRLVHGLDQIPLSSG